VPCGATAAKVFTNASGLPGLAFPGERERYPSKEAVADYLRRYVETLQLPVRTGSLVTRVSRLAADFDVETATWTLRTRRVVVATGPFQTPASPQVADGLAATVLQLHSSDYRNPGQLPDGPVLVVGSGNSGMQIAHELAATRPVHLSVGTESSTLPQRLLGRDIFWWLTRTGIMGKAADSRLARRVRARGELVIGTSLRKLRRAGGIIHSRTTRTEAATVSFVDGGSVSPAAIVVHRIPPPLLLAEDPGRVGGRAPCAPARGQRRRRAVLPRLGVAAHPRLGLARLRRRRRGTPRRPHHHDR
jgi:putative flavoprotein involved in K+ transport